MWPMLGGLRPLVGDGLLGSFEGRSGKSKKWTATDPQFDVAPPAALNDLESAWVAVLTGPQTASSGEIVDHRLPRPPAHTVVRSADEGAARRATRRSRCPTAA